MDPRQRLVALLQLSSVLQKLGRLRETLSLLIEAEEAARTIGQWEERNRLAHANGSGNVKIRLERNTT